jgi:carbon-monoxide dehydrogenase medium subunit/2-furoyl-CoA dehydrogenase FAD binding subunit
VKAAPFNYLQADNLAHALALLAEHGGDAKLLAGGQSLVPMMAMRLARPALLVDINRLAELKTIQPSATAITMGAGVRQRDVEDARTLDMPLPLVQQALRWVGHAQTRNRGTVGGSLVHADPSAELPLAALVLNATMRLHSQTDGERSVSAQDFFLGPMFTAVGETECLTAVDWPVWQGGFVASAFDETAIRHGDFAMASAACQVQLDAEGVVSRASMGVGGVSGAPLAFPVFAQQLVGQRMTPALAQELAHAAAQQCDPGSDMHASADFRRHLAATLLARVLVKAAAAAQLTG